MERGPDRQLWLHYGMILLIAGSVFFINLGGPKLWDRDETRNARCTLEMLERGDWVVPYYNGEVRDAKPAGMYWFMMSAVGLFGATEFAFRFWSAVAGLGTALATYHIGRRLFNAEVGLWGGVMLATSLMFAVMSRTAKVDALLILCITTSLLVYVLTTFRSARQDRSKALLVSERPGGDGPVGDGPERQGVNSDCETTWGCAAESRTPEYFPQSWWAAAGMYACLAAAVLGKGPIGFIVPIAVLGMFLLVMRLPAESDGASWTEPSLRWQGGGLVLTAFWLMIAGVLTKISLEFGCLAFLLLGVHLLVRRLPIFRPFAPGHFLSTCWVMRPITAISLLMLIAGPWHLWVGFRNMDWLNGFYLVNNLGRATTAMEHHGGSDLAYYPITICLGLVPWSMFLVPMLIDLVKRCRREHPWRSGSVFLACWAGVYLVLLSLARTKLPNYVVPSYPAWALLTGCYFYQLRHALAESPAWMPRLAIGVLATTGLGLLIGLPIAAHVYLPGDEWLGLVGLIPLAGAAVCYGLLRRDQVRAATLCYAGCAVALTLALLAGVAQRADGHQRLLTLLEAARRQSATPEIASFACLEPSWVLYSGQNIHEFRPEHTEATRAYFDGDADRFLITTDEYWPVLRKTLPDEAAVMAECPRFLRDGRLLLIGRTVVPQIAETPSEPGGGTHQR